MDVVVVGGGTMGAGIAQCLLEAGATVALTESDGGRATAAYDRVAAGLGRRFKDDADRVSELLDTFDDRRRPARRRLAGPRHRGGPREP